MTRILGLETVEGRYRCIYLDPPWSYERRPLGRKDLNDVYTGGTMDLDQIKGLPVPELGHPDRKYHVFLWCTWPKMRDNYHVEVFDAWQLRWVSELVWDKQSMGTGRRFRKQTELLLAAVPKDAPVGLTFGRHDQRDIVRVKGQRGSGKHSKKPDEVRKVIETVAAAPRIELFARCNPRGWDVWGYEAPQEERE